MRAPPIIDLEQDLHDQDIMVEQTFYISTGTMSMEREDKSKCRKDDRYRLGGNLMKTDGNVNDTRGHGS
eukprot:4009095-Heterocapsa_arctica.AAC.1